MRYGYHPAERRERTQKEQGFYKTPAWRRIRVQALNRDHYLCQLRTSSKCSGIATEVHHILPLAHGGTHNADNLMALCKACHSRISAESGDRWRNKKPRKDE